MSDADPTKPDLTFVDTAWMIEELMGRYDAMLIVRQEKPNDQSHDVWFDYSGGVSNAIGLAVRAKARLLKSARLAERQD